MNVPIDPVPFASALANSWFAHAAPWARVLSRAWSTSR